MNDRFKAILLGLSLLGAATSAAAAGVPDGRCAELAGIHLKDVEIVAATLQAPDLPVAGAALPTMGAPNTAAVVSGLPAFCRVIGRIRPTPDSDIGFEVWLPRDNWDGRLSGIGNGGSASPVLGRWRNWTARSMTGLKGAGRSVC